MINKKVNIILIVVILVVAISLIACASNAKTGEIKNSNEQRTNTAKSDYTKFSGLDMEDSKLKLKLEGKEVNFKLPIYIDKNRHYIPLNEIIEKQEGKIIEEENTLKISLLNKDIKINLSDNSYYNGSEEVKLKKNIINKEGLYYISFYDFSKMFNLTTRWNGNKNSVDAYISRHKKVENKYEAKLETPGFIRLEDLAATNTAYDNELFERLRIMGDYLNEKAVPFHLAWVPRYIVPESNVDEDPSKKNSIYFADLVYSLDYLSDRGGVVGLHGYTHQNGKENSLAGTEFGGRSGNIAKFKERIEAAKNVAKYLDINIGFFEAPHYAINLEENKELEKDFDYIYHNFINENRKMVNTKKPFKSTFNNKTYYIDTPLDYAKNGNVDEMLGKINKLPQDTIASLFYHPVYEYGFIKLKGSEDGYPEYTYSDDANLKRIVTALEARGYKMIKVTDIK